MRWKKTDSRHGRGRKALNNRKERLFERLETRAMLSAGEWLVRFTGVPGDTRDAQLPYIQGLLHGAGLDSQGVVATRHVGVDGVVIVHTDPSASLAAVRSELEAVRGFASIEPWDATASPSSRSIYVPEPSFAALHPGNYAAPASATIGPSAASGKPLAPSSSLPSAVQPNFGSPPNFGAQLGIGSDGINATTNFDSPPDTNGAVGPSSFIEAVNTSLAVYDKTTGVPITGGAEKQFSTFFSSVDINAAGFSDPVVLYNDVTQRFAVEIIEIQVDNMGNLTGSPMDFAISTSSNPTLAPSDWNFFQYNTNDGTGMMPPAELADYPKMGYNADGYVVSFNMFVADPMLGFVYDHVSLLGIGNDGTSAGIRIVPGGITNFTLAPASMHGAAPGAPMWFVQDGHGGGGGKTITVVRLDKPFSASPINAKTFAITVPTYGNTKPPRQPGGTLGGLDPTISDRTDLGTRFYFSGLRTVNGVTHLVSADAIGNGTGVSARWYDLDVTGGQAKLIQEGDVNPDPATIDTYFPGVDIGPDGSIGMNYSESGLNEFMSMYVTGRTAADALGFMNVGTLAKTNPVGLDALGRAGDYSSTTVDPVDGTFWSANEYASSFGIPNWATWIQHFKVVGLSVVSSIPANGDVVFTAPTSFVIDFSAPIDPSSLQPTALNVNLVPADSVTLSPDGTVATFTYNVSPVMAHGPQTMTMAARAVTALDNTPNHGVAVFSATFTYAAVVTTPIAPLGSLIYQAAAIGLIFPAAHTDTFTLTVNPGQTISVLVTPTSAGLQPAVQLLDPNKIVIGSATAAAPGQNALIETSATTGSTIGTYKVIVSSAAGTTGEYTVQLTLNSVLETEGLIAGVSDNTLDTAQALDGSFTTLSSTGPALRGAVVGQTDQTGSYTVSAVSPTFEDISATGTVISGLTGMDDATASIPIGFAFPFYTTLNSNIFVSSNGLLTFLSGNNEYLNQDMTTDPSQAAIAPFWDDLVVTGTSNSNVLYQLIGSGSSRHLTIEWNQVSFYAGGTSGDTLTFEAQLYADGRIQFNYQDLVSGTAPGNDGGSATVGIKAAGPQGSDRLLLASNNGPNNFVGTGQSTLITPPATPDYYKVNLNAGEQITAGVTGLAKGKLNLDLRDATDSIVAPGLLGPTNLTEAISNFIVPVTATYYVRISGDANVPYSLVITRNLSFDTEPNDSFAKAQNVDGTHGALGYVVGAVGPTVFDSFDDGPSDLSNYTFTSTNNASIAAAAAHDGPFGLQLGDRTEWMYRDDMATHVQQGDTISAWVQASAIAGRAYIGFGASASGALSMVLGGNSGTLILQDNSGYNFKVIASATQTWKANHWYRFEINWQVGGTIIGRLYDSDGVTLLNTVSATDTAITSGGIAFRGFGAKYFIDTVTGPPPKPVEDWYSITVTSVSPYISLSTSTPSGGSGQFTNVLMPQLQLYDASDTLVASGVVGPDGRNQQLAYLASPGVYRVRVSAATGTKGEYFLNTAGSLRVVGSTPAVGAIVATPPADYVINFSDPVDPASLLPSALTVNSHPADQVALSADETTATFTFVMDPVTVQGLQTMTIAAGALTKLGDSTNTIAPFNGTFRYDAVLLQVTSTNPPAGGKFTLPGPFIYDVTFNEPVAPATITTSSLTLGGISGAMVTGASVLAGNTTAEFTIGGITAEGTLNVNIAAGAITDQYGNPGAAFSATYFVDMGTTALPVPLTPVAPLGSLIYDPMATGIIFPGADSDTFTLAVNPGQSMTVLVTPTGAGGLQPTVQLLDPTNAAIGSSTAAAPGQNALLQTIATNSSTTGIYKVVVSGAAGTSGGYTVQVTLNAALESEGNVAGASDNTEATAQTLDGSFVNLTPTGSATRGAVVGQTDGVGSGGYGTTAVTPPTFEDIGTTGTVISGLIGADDKSVSIPIGFAFPFFGALNSTIYVSSNGLLTFGSANSEFANTDLTSDPTQAAIAPFWDDLVVGGGPKSNVLSQVIGTGANQHLTIQWNQVSFYTGGTDGDTLTFEAQLYADGRIQFNYQDLVSGAALGNDGGSATVGIKAAGTPGSNRVLLAFNNGPNSFVGTGKSTLIAPPLTPDYYKLTLNAGEIVTVAATGLSAGNLGLDLRDGTNAVLATGVGGSSNVTEVISNYSVGATATYYVRVSGDANLPYSLLITRNASFDTNPHNSFATAQSLDGVQGVLGYVGGSTPAVTTSTDQDWYSITVNSSSTAIILSTSTPSVGPGQFTNALSPQIQLYSPADTLVASGTTGPDGRNQTLTYIASPGVYRVRATAAGSTQGEYFLVSQTGFEVTNTLDSGAGSLRQALLNSAGAPGLLHTILFAVPSGPQTINLLSPLPAATGPLTMVLDATQHIVVASSASTGWDSYAALTKTGDGSLTLTETSSFGGNIGVSGGLLRLNNPATPTFAAGVGATLTDNGILELAGSVSAMTSAVNVNNNSTAAAGIIISGTKQVVGNIDGSGNLVVNAGSDLTANRIRQNALTIGGTAGSPSIVTLAASDGSGNPLITATSSAAIVASASVGAGNSSPPPVTGQDIRPIADNTSPNRSSATTGSASPAAVVEKELPDHSRLAAPIGSVAPMSPAAMVSTPVTTEPAVSYSPRDNLPRPGNVATDDRPRRQTTATQGAIDAILAEAEFATTVDDSLWDLLAGATHRLRPPGWPRGPI